MKVPDLRTNRLGALPRFLMAGGMATLLHWLIMMVLVRAGVNAVAATAIGASAGLIANYIGQHRFAFCSALPHRVTFPRYLAGAGIGWILNLLSFVLLRIADANVAFAQITATGVVALANYLFAERFVFHEEPTREAR
ncbi:GtrA family protein [Marinobacter pelagius]|uniref:Putative flippase GtrA (Transmembrane translocase of bactoprenol-linked glucose) n=1 Tax=Marinobacter pelagius TaxID=379482 RepID=A0A1I4R1L6_9GAMM|nr:GtrA family protein [Marinobacter pelagius]SFM46141.1 Putative flippase GtrA (transmembrane translocase of bactoprenol-linked glucose) [Marinobacter pelagius]